MNEVAQSGDARVKHLTKEAADKEFSGQCRISGLARDKASFPRRSFWFSSSAVKNKTKKEALWEQKEKTEQQQRAEFPPPSSKRVTHRNKA